MGAVRVELPFCKVTLTASRPILPAYPRQLKTPGDYIRKRRLDLGLLQEDVARRLGIDTDSATNCEKNRYSPRLYPIPKVIEFLGYVPDQYNHDGKSLGERIVGVRRVLGIRQDQLAREFGVDPSTLARWERGDGRPSERNLGRLTDFFEANMINQVIATVEKTNK